MLLDYTDKDQNQIPQRNPELGWVSVRTFSHKESTEIPTKESNKGDSCYNGMTAMMNVMTTTREGGKCTLQATENKRKIKTRQQKASKRSVALGFCQ